MKVLTGASHGRPYRGGAFRTCSGRGATGGVQDEPRFSGALVAQHKRAAAPATAGVAAKKKMGRERVEGGRRKPSPQRSGATFF